MKPEARGKRLHGRLRPASLIATGLLLVTLVWAAPRLWDYAKYRRCLQSTCLPSSADEPPIHLASGRNVPVIRYWRSEDGHVTIDYVTQQDARRLAELCREAKEVWAALLDSARVGGASEVHLGPTSAKPEYLGALGCQCRNIYLSVRRSEAGDWQFWQTACADK